MKKQLRDDWVNALRSGEYKQTTNTLRRFDEDGNPSYCCLGVLSVLCDAPYAQISDNFLTHVNLVVGHAVDGDCLLANMNDEGKSFPFIADWIEANVPVEEA